MCSEKIEGSRTSARIEHGSSKKMHMKMRAREGCMMVFLMPDWRLNLATFPR
jgi:hypothetical protein